MDWTSSVLMYGMYPSVSHSISTPSGRIKIGVAEKAGHQKLYPKFMHLRPSDNTSGVDSKTYGVMISSRPGMESVMSLLAGVCPLAVLKMRGFWASLMCFVSRATARRDIKSLPHPESSIQRRTRDFGILDVAKAATTS